MVPSKIQNFVWMVFHGKIATTDNLQQRGFNLARKCVLCNKQSESIDQYLFRQCEFSCMIWNRFSSALSLLGPFQNDMVGFILAWKGMNCISRFKDVIKVLLHATLWCIWLERNRRIFREESRSTLQILHQICSLVGVWLQSWGMFSCTMISNWYRFVFDNG
ncbi:hypothetical protein LINGRAHAP2_LOCUS13060 [Linum grandiflorum]